MDRGLLTPKPLKISPQKLKEKKMFKPLKSWETDVSGNIIFFFFFKKKAGHCS